MERSIRDRGNSPMDEELTEAEETSSSDDSQSNLEEDDAQSILKNTTTH